MTDRSDFDLASRPLRLAMVAIFVLMLAATAAETLAWLRTPVPRAGFAVRLGPLYGVLLLTAAAFIRRRVFRGLAAVGCVAALLASFVAR